MAGEWMSGGDSFNRDASPLNKDVFMELVAPAMVGDRCRRVGKKRLFEQLSNSLPATRVCH